MILILLMLLDPPSVNETKIMVIFPQELRVKWMTPSDYRELQRSL